jgi:hypothetical protein
MLDSCFGVFPVISADLSVSQVGIEAWGVASDVSLPSDPGRGSSGSATRWRLALVLGVDEDDHQVVAWRKWADHVADPSTATARLIVRVKGSTVSSGARFDVVDAVGKWNVIETAEQAGDLQQQSRNRNTNVCRRIGHQPPRKIPRAPTEVSHQDIFNITTLAATDCDVTAKIAAAVPNSMPEPVAWALTQSAATALSESAGCRPLTRLARTRRCPAWSHRRSS